MCFAVGKSCVFLGHLLCGILTSRPAVIKENGPFNWMVGQYEPVKNHYAWNNLSNVVWIEQPVGTGYSRGTPTAKSEDDIVVEFGKFWKNFIDLFDLKERKVYITGESYAGM